MEKGQWGTQGMGGGKSVRPGFFNCLLQTCWTKFCFHHFYFVSVRAVQQDVLRPDSFHFHTYLEKILKERANELVIN